jgi:ribonucleoside-diphosphate reductase alpha chain
MATYEDYYWLNDKSKTFLSQGYLEKGVEAEQRFQDIADTAEKILGIAGFSEKFLGYFKRGFYSLASPVISNFGTKRGLPISCNGSYIDDTLDAILFKQAEVGAMTKYGAGTSAYFGDLRPRGAAIRTGGATFGPVHFMQLYDKVTDIVSQSNIRRGSMAAYLPVEHADILEFLQIKGEGNPIQSLSIGVCIGDEWMQSMLDGDKDKRKIWGKIIQKRFETGYPYIFFTDTVNNNAPQVYKDKGLKVYASNLCSEIALAANAEESFVCDLSSLNLLHWDLIKETDAIETLTYFLDAVNTEYIEKTADLPFMQHAHNFAKRQRAIGVGVLGWHSYLQSKMIPFESMEAKMLSNSIFKLIDEKTLQASKEMAQLFGEPELLKGYGERCVTRVAIAPTTSSSFIIGQVSPSVEPLNGNYFTKDLAKGKFKYKNPFLKDLLKSYDKNTPEVWQSILIKGGSVQHLDFLTDNEKDVFKTFGEISQMEIIIQASIRQKYIDQSQSINLMIHANTSPKEVSQLLIEAWKLGVKTLYYQRSTNPAQELTRSIMTCKSCEA